MIEKLGFTGTQRGMTGAQRDAFTKFIDRNKPSEFHHGDCVGADSIASSIAISREIYSVVHPPENSSKRCFAVCCERRNPKPYLDRNHDIVDETDSLVACPGEKEEQQRSGTWATIRYARKQNKQVFIIWPDGSIKLEAAQMNLF